MRLLAMGLLLMGPASFASQIFQDYGPFMLPSDGAGQLTSTQFDIPVETTGLLQLRYQAPYQHCASLKVHVLLDRREITVSPPMAPNELTDYLDLGPVAPGDHVVSLRGEGISGGCNTGRVTAWGGKGTVWTASADASGAPPDLGEIIFQSEYVNGAWGYQFRGTLIDSDGRLFSYELPPARSAALPAVRNQVLAEHWLAARYEFQRRELGRVSKSEMDQALGLARRLKTLPPQTLSLRPAAYDSGALSYALWVREADHYRYIELAQRGDQVGDLKGAQAEALRAWLMKTVELHAKVIAP